MIEWHWILLRNRFEGSVEVVGIMCPSRAIMCKWSQVLEGKSTIELRHLAGMSGKEELSW